MTHTKHTWAAAPSPDAVFTPARYENLAKQYDDARADFGVTGASRVVATSTSVHKASADYVCDGVNDEVQIQAAIDDCAAKSGGLVVLLEGTYTLGANVKLKNNITIEGMGTNTLLSLGSYDILNDDTTFGNTGIVLKGLKLSGGDFKLQNCKTLPPVKLYLVSFSDCLITLNICRHVVFERCKLNTTAFQRNTFTDCKNIHFTHNRSYRGYIAFYSSQDCIINDNTFDGQDDGTYAFMYLSACDDCIVSHNTFQKTSVDYYGYGIVDEKGVRNLISGNIVANFKQNGIQASDTKGTLINNNIVIYGASPTGNGIYLSGASVYLNVTGNNIYNNYGVGIWGSGVGGSSSTTTWCVMNHNVIYKNGMHGILNYAPYHDTLIGNMLVQNGVNTDNTYSNIYVGYSVMGDLGNSIITSNMCYKGFAAPQSAYGIKIMFDSADNLVTENYLAEAGATANLSDGGHQTDKTDWITGGNKLTET